MKDHFEEEVVRASKVAEEDVDNVVTLCMRDSHKVAKHREACATILDGHHECPTGDDECFLCAAILCPAGYVEHLFHDGCPYCVDAPTA